MKLSQSTLKEHEQLIDSHEDRLEDIQQDLIDIKTRLGIKDLTNGQVVEYQKRLVKAIDEEKDDRKEQDKILQDEIKELRSMTWGILTSVIFVIVFQLMMMLLPLIFH